MTGPATVSDMSWTERAADRSPMVQKWRTRNIEQMKIVVDAAKRLIVEKGSAFTTQELVREAGVAIQTFYRHFGSKDQLLLAVLEDIITDQAVRYEAAARELPNPVARLEYYVKTALAGLDADEPAQVGPRFVTAEHWRLQQLFPEETERATQPFADLLARELRAAAEAGLLTPRDVEHDADLMNLLVRSAYHRYAFAARREPAEAIADHVWEFCLVGMGGTVTKEAPTSGGSTPTPA
jgi:AcrR family transcriptional regulator